MRKRLLIGAALLVVLLGIACFIWYRSITRQQYAARRPQPHARQAQAIIDEAVKIFPSYRAKSVHEEPLAKLVMAQAILDQTKAAALAQAYGLNIDELASELASYDPEAAWEFALFNLQKNQQLYGMHDYTYQLSSIISGAAERHPQWALNAADRLVSMERREHLANARTLLFKADFSGASDEMKEMQNANARETYNEALGSSLEVLAKYDPQTALRIARDSEDSYCEPAIITEWARKDIDAALQSARSMANVGNRAETLTNIAALCIPKDLTKAKQLIEEAYKLAQTLKAKDERDYALAELAALMLVTDPGRAVQVANRVKEWESCFGFPEEVDVVLRTMDPKALLAVAQKVKSIHWQSEIQYQAVRQIAGKEPERAIKIAKKIKFQCLPSKSYKIIALRVASHDFEKAQRINKAATYSCCKLDEFTDIFHNYAKANPERSCAVAEKTKDPQKHDARLAVIARVLARKDTNQALHIARQIGDRKKRAEALGSIAFELVTPDFPEDEPGDV
jgi:hypothetical protein